MSSFCAGMLMGPILSRSCAANHSLSEFMGAMVMSRPENSNFLHSLALALSSAPSSGCFLSVGGEGIDRGGPFGAEHSAVILSTLACCGLCIN